MRRRGSFLAGSLGSRRLLAASSPGRPLALTELRSDAEQDRITYANAVGSITVELDRTRGVPSDGEPVIVRGGPGRRTDSTLSWLGPDNAVVEVSWSGAVDDAMIDACSWRRSPTSTTTPGSKPLAPAASAERPAESAHQPFEIDAASRRSTVDVNGDLHEGLQLSGSVTSGIRRPGRRGAARQRSPTTPQSREPNVAGYVILAPGDVSTVVVSTDGKTRTDAST
jgi:hypothetical protein